MSSKTKRIKYIDYINEFSKSDITDILDTFSIKYKSNLKKEDLEDLLMSSLEQIVLKIIDLTRKEEYSYLKLIIKKKGIIKIRHNKLLLNYCKFMSDKKIFKEVELNEFIVPMEILNIFKQKIKLKKSIEKIKSNTVESNIIKGFIDAYGVVEYDFFYIQYSKKYKDPLENAINRVKEYSKFYNEYSIIDDKYIASNLIKNAKDASKYLKSNETYAIYSPSELIEIHNFTYLSKKRSYKKMINYITKLYAVNKEGVKLINKYILNPYNEYYQYDKSKSNDIILSLLDDFFEPYKDKYRDKLVEYINDFMDTCPSWLLKGNIRKDK